MISQTSAELLKDIFAQLGDSDESSRQREKFGSSVLTAEGEPTIVPTMKTTASSISSLLSLTPIEPYPNTPSPLKSPTLPLTTPPPSPVSPPQPKSPTPPPKSPTPPPKTPTPPPKSPTPPPLTGEDFAASLANFFRAWAQASQSEISPTPEPFASTKPFTSQQSIPRAATVQEFYPIPTQLESKLDKAILTG